MIAWPSWFRNQADRTANAIEVQRQLDPRRIDRIVAKTFQVADSLQATTTEQLRDHTVNLQRLIRQGESLTDPEFLALAGGGVIEATRRQLGLTLFKVQIKAGIIVSLGAVAQMQTGEGKTLSGILPAYVHALSGRGVHVATTNTYLAKRDHDELTGVFQGLGLTTGLLEDDATDEQAQASYRADITYGPGHSFGFDFLRDQLTMARDESCSLGAQVFQRSSGSTSQSALRQRPLATSIIDEIDHVLLDDAASPLILSTSSEGTAIDADVHDLARELVDSTLVQEQHYLVDVSKKTVELTDAGFEIVYENAHPSSISQIFRPWHEYVVLALRAECILFRDVDYVLSEDKIQLVDQATGRVFEDRHWSDGLHQAVLAAESLPITPETSSLAKITRQRFYRHYQTLGGMTGTAKGCESEFASVYGLPVQAVELRVPSRREMHAPIVRATLAEKYAAIADEVDKMFQARRAVLVGTNSISESLLIGEELQRRGIQFQLLNGVQDKQEADIISLAGQPGAVTVATNLAGRGTDIKLHADVKQIGGLHVIAAAHHSLARVDRQLVGRSARCGDPGSARIYVSAEDDLFRQHAPWVARSITRRLNANQLAGLQGTIEKLQRSHQSRMASQRWEMLQQDRQQEELVQRNDELQACWQI